MVEMPGFADRPRGRGAFDEEGFGASKFMATGCRIGQGPNDTVSGKNLQHQRIPVSQVKRVTVTSLATTSMV
jgi:hypothetical protein